LLSNQRTGSQGNNIKIKKLKTNISISRPIPVEESRRILITEPRPTVMVNDLALLKTHEAEKNIKI